jgi:hypothetical protein
VKIRFWTSCVRPSSRVQTVSEIAMRSLEERRKQRMQELGNYRPRRGWLKDELQPPEELDDTQVATVLRLPSILRRQAE